jgi:hypothetical protein
VTLGLSFTPALWILIAVGTAARLVVAFATDGHGDINAFRYAAICLDDPAHFYSNVNRTVLLWPYPPGFLALVQAAEWLNLATGAAFAGLVRVPAIACDAALAWLTQRHLATRGAGEWARLYAVALISLGPAFAAVSGYHGQIDAVAILPAVAAVIFWKDSDAPWRPYVAGVLIGLGGAVKIVPLLMLLALLPTARSVLEAAKLTAAALAIPALLLAPFFFADAGAVREALSYNGLPGLGGASLVLDPSAPLTAFGLETREPSKLAATASEHSKYVLGPGLAVVGLVLIRRRTEPVLAACVVWLTVYALGINMFNTYVVWGLPFFLLAGYLWQTALLQLWLFPALVLSYVLIPARDVVTLHPWEVWVFYTVPMIGLWIALTVAFVRLLRRQARPPQAGDSAPSR